MRELSTVCAFATGYRGVRWLGTRLTVVRVVQVGVYLCVRVYTLCTCACILSSGGVEYRAFFFYHSLNIAVN